ncbi:MAG: signal peptidase II [Gammaproteobacteria bacterium]
MNLRLNIANAWPWLLLTASIVVLDQFTKLLAEHYLAFYTPVNLLDVSGTGLNMTLVYNTGAAFSFLSDAGGWQRWVFAVFAVLVSAVLLIWLLRLPAAARWLSAALALVLGGAIGNLIDRVLYGHVIDFVDFYSGDWHFPAFNLADSAITIGAIMLIIDALWLQSDAADRTNG